ncbi:dihydrodipicolinate synthase family protein [Arthrobacter bambusae]|uniref:dihydrodipicolinate synthase family protein n=1 Tax=Arthrobacter bambusae TaxID=1338426 RepID=UPI0027857A92|nr:dihydrodipicolinate synthase family protein [Arthrobacter bambusae]MDQ0213489.1 4-hydroxy-tetrahydrodipicolinate synthase [Arthrobacter bambusae]MDQ0237800.1 4-hydroxy-tetrahydrodipicolinate synthase [Arthrobacter bambusae]
MVTTAIPAGAMVALATPVNPDGSLDPKGLERLLEHVVAGGVAGISPCGSTGEGARLTRDDRLCVARQVLEQAAGLPVIPGVAATSLLEARHELDLLGELGATAALVAPPSYFPSTDAETEDLYIRLADDSPIPLVLYNIPQFTKAPVRPGVVGRLMLHPNIIGIKDSSRDLEYLQSVISATAEAKLTGDFRIYTGTDTMLVASALAGADGTIAASANLVPHLGVQIMESVSTDLRQAMELQKELAVIVYACRKGSPPGGWKAALSLAGMCDRTLVPPAIGLSEDEVEELRRELQQTMVFAPESKGTS